MLEVVWFKRDLRIDDHQPLVEAARRGPVLPLYIIEPELIGAPDYDALHWDFIRGSLAELDRALGLLGQPLVVHQGPAVDVLTALHAERGIRRLWSHEETGNAVTYARDRAVSAWCRRSGVAWHEIPSHGVVRRLRSRDGWARHWERRMQRPLEAAPAALPPAGNGQPAILPTASELGLRHYSRRGAVQSGGSRAAAATLSSFLAVRGRDYRFAMSAPGSAHEACSRLSSHLAYGTISLRAVVHATRAARAKSTERAWQQSLVSFERRLHWHCHFMQKLESEPAIEFACFNRSAEALRGPPDASRLAAFLAGQTGYPFIDACMRSLHEHGWINFRMRAMLTSFAAYDLWLDWRSFRDPLARSFQDYEPGIHYSQLQMQSGTTGINTPRLYNPLKQALDHDPDGSFVRRYVPALQSVPLAYLHTPWMMDAGLQQRCGVRLGDSYPQRIVRHEHRVAEIRAALSELRARPSHRADAAKVYDRHGSRLGAGRQAASARARRLAGADATPPQRSGERGPQTGFDFE